jgi:CMP-N,N'-diacetyllegionaminic acid synthase
MQSKTRLLAIVPARGGSKRLPGKNIMLLGGRPLINWTINTAIDSSVCIDVLVSTDDNEIASVARSAGAMVPWLRPSVLATDTASSAEVIAHALAWYEEAHGTVDAVLLLQPTSPFRSSETIRGAVRTYTGQRGTISHSVVSVSPAASHPAWSFNWRNGVLLPCLGWEALKHRSQDLEPAFTLNGAVYVIPANDVRAKHPIVRPGTLPFIMNDSRENLDIDTAEDWVLATHWARVLQTGSF